MMTFEEVVEQIAPLDAAVLEHWIASGWVLPAAGARTYQFTEVDVARVRLISEMRFDLMIDEEAMPVVLTLLDQIYGLRRQLKRLDRAISAQPSGVRAAIASSLEHQPDET